MRRSGFTLIELLIVMIIILLLMTAAVALFNEMFRGQEVRSAGEIIVQAVSDARELAAKEQTIYFVRFYNNPAKNSGVIEVYKDSDKNRQLDPAVDKLAPGGTYTLPKFCFFADTTVGIGAKIYPDWAGIYPTGYLVYSPGYTGVQRTAFDANFNSPNPTLMGDVAVVVKGRPYQMGLDIDTAAGKVRRTEFLFKE
jgi:prepilin-type N-terminal cleavage/methylation domain-containing protein